MSRHTSDQYSLGVDIGHLLAAAIKNGMSFAEAGETLSHQMGLLQFSESTGRTFADYEPPPQCAVCERSGPRNEPDYTS